MTKYKCGHESEIIILDDNILSITAWMDWKDTVGLQGDKPQCWECYCCVKICPQQAIEVRGYTDFMPLGASSTPLMGTEDIMWTIKFRDGRIKRFKYPTRTTPEGSIKPLEGYPEAKVEDLANQLLLGEPEIMGVKELPTKK